ncbi:MAG TPA: hypothetical protein VFT04_08220 [Gemmatimonadales bacterium]|nr:hypothetical protein [Gemmatimonadales bacterium]
MRTSFRATVLLGLVLAAAPRTAAAQHADGAAEASLLEVRLGQVASRTLPALRIGDEALLPLGQFFELAEVKVSLDSAGRLTAVLEPEGITFAVEAGETHARANERFIAIPAGYVRFLDGDLYLASSVLAALIESEIVIDWAALEATVVDPSRFPVAERDRRARVRAALASREPGAEATRIVTGSRRAWDGFVLDYSWFAPSSDLIGGSSYAVAAGADVFGGSLEASVRSTGRAADGDVDVDGSWLGVWRGSRWVQQLRLGDGPASGPRPRNVRGLFLTNAPYVRPSLLGSYAYNGRLPAGWEVEAYRGGQLVGLDSVLADGSYAVEVPVLFGENPIEFVAYGPFGERQTFSRTYRAHSALLPAGRMEYAASAGACRFAPCDASANADVRYGVSRRWTANAGMERIWRDTIPDLSHPYLSAIGSLTYAWTMQAEVMANALVRGGLAFEPNLNVRVSADYTRFDRDVVASFANPLNRRSQLRVATFIRPDLRRDYFYFDATAELATRADGTSMRLHGGVSARMGGLRVQPYARLERDRLTGAEPASRAFAGLSAFFIPSGRVGPLLRNSWFRASYESEGLTTPRLATISIARPLLNTLRIETGVSWIRGAGAPTFTLTLASAFDVMRGFTSVSAQAGAPTSVTQYLQGSVLYDRHRGVALDAGPSLQRAGVAGTVFLDQNGNGVRDGGEEGLPNVRVQVGTGSAVSDSLGEYRVWDIVPFEPVVVAADSMSFESPLWVAGDEVLAVMPSPNHFTAVDVPLSTGAVLEGKVVRAFGGGLQGVAGATLELREQRTGRRRSVVTFTDGSFYMLGVPPGEYALEVGPRTLELLRQTAEPLRFTVSFDGVAPANLELRLAPSVR